MIVKMKVPRRCVNTVRGLPNLCERSDVSDPSCVVYALSLDGLNHRYVGLTRGRLNHRIANHRREARIGTRRPVYDWIRKYGVENLHVTVLEHATDPADLYEIEQRWIADLRVAGYDLLNLSDGGPGAYGCIRSEETRQKLRDKVITEEARQRMSESAKRRGPNNRGKPMSEANKRAISEANRGRVATPESRAKMSAAGRGRPKSPETRAKMSAAHKGRTKTPEHVAKIAAAVRARNARLRGCGQQGTLW